MTKSYAYCRGLFVEYIHAVREAQTAWDNLNHSMADGIFYNSDLYDEWRILKDKELSLHKEVMEHIFGGNDESR